MRVRCVNCYEKFALRCKRLFYFFFFFWSKFYFFICPSQVSDTFLNKTGVTHIVVGGQLDFRSFEFFYSSFQQRREIAQKEGEKIRERDGWSPGDEENPSHQVSSETSQTLWSVVLIFFWTIGFFTSTYWLYSPLTLRSMHVCTYVFEFILYFCSNSYGFCWIGLRFVRCL